MNGRILLRDGATRLTATGNFAGIHIGTYYDADYLARMPTTYPAVWFMSSRMSRLTDGRGVTGMMRQRMSVDIAVRLVLPRSVEGVTDAEPALDVLFNKVSTAMLGWLPPGAEQGFVWTSGRDGAPFETLVVADLVFSSTVMYQQPAA